MTTKQYEQFVVDMAQMGLTDDAYNVIGLCGEAGEVAEFVKKSVFRKDPKYTPVMLRGELGDVLHYLTRIAIRNGFTLEQVMQDNVDKISARKAQKQKVFASHVPLEHTCIKDDGGTPNRRCYACEKEVGSMR